MTRINIESPMPDYERFRPPAWLTPAHIAYWRFMERTDGPGIRAACYPVAVALTPTLTPSPSSPSDPGQAAPLPPNPDCGGRATRVMVALSLVAIAALMVGGAWLVWHPITWH